MEENKKHDDSPRVGEHDDAPDDRHQTTPTDFDEPQQVTRDVVRDDARRSIASDPGRDGDTHPMETGPEGKKPEDEHDANAMAQQRNMNRPQHDDETMARGDDEDKAHGDDKDKSSG